MSVRWCRAGGGEVVCCAGRLVPDVAAMAGAACPVSLLAWDTPGAIAPGLVARAGPVAAAGPARIGQMSEISLPSFRRPIAPGSPDMTVDLPTAGPDLRAAGPMSPCEMMTGYP